MKSNNIIYKKSTTVEYNILDEEAVILIPKKGEFFSLNKTGTRIFKLINGKNDVKTIIKRISKDFNLKEEKAEKDVIEFLNQLRKKNILKIK